MTFVEINLTHITGIPQFLFFDTPKEAVEDALARGLIEDEASAEASVYLLIDSDGDRRWAVQPGHDGWGVHCRLEDVRTADAWYDEDCAYTNNPELANS